MVQGVVTIVQNRGLLMMLDHCMTQIENIQDLE